MLRRYSDAWFAAAKRRTAGDPSARFPRRKRGLVPVRLRREVGRTVAKARILADAGPGDEAPTFSRSQLSEAWGIGE